MKAIVVGGSNGIGLAITKTLITRGYYVIILDKTCPEKSILPERTYQYIHCDLLELDEEILTDLANDPEISLLMITAGFGRISDFACLHSIEIKNMLTVNATSTIRVLHIFYNRIRSTRRFYCGVMGSISGYLSSPLAAVYAASKAAVCRFIESINIELEVFGTKNRILNVSPASFEGSRFYGGENQLDVLEKLAEDIIFHIFASDELFIPQYEEIYKKVIERYKKDPHKYGLYSYTYKMQSGRVDNSRHVRIGYLSGTFDLFHIGHLSLLYKAKEKCDYLIVGVHKSGAWKGKETFIPFEERKAIVRACKYVDKVVDSCMEDSDAWALWHYDMLFAGSDYQKTERFNRYEEHFKDKGVEIVFFPYTKSTNSTQIRRLVNNMIKSSEHKDK